MDASKFFSMSAFIIVAAVLLLAADDGVNGCSLPNGWRPQQPVEVLYNANDAIYGRVIDKKRDAQRWIEVYTITVEVYCILKGDPTPATIQVTGVGTIDGMCVSTDMDVGSDYIILVWPMSTTRDYFSAMDRFPVADRAALASFSYACGIQQTYPIGVRPGVSNSRPACPTPVPSGQCFDQEYFERQYYNQYPPSRRPPTRPRSNFASHIAIRRFRG